MVEGCNECIPDLLDYLLLRMRQNIVTYCMKLYKKALDIEIV